MISKELLKILLCPDNMTPLALADDELVLRLNDAIAGRRLVQRSGATVESQLDGALVREDGQIAYPIIDDIPVLLVDEGIPLDQLNGT